ncbi:MAG TPA: tripartite tricarboxylate transporter substrate-binding protein, partial [Caldimonas sp.]|nr:tripartite tricarboxylate transporter substrate-binding protein [Caldimonas sp.]
MKRRLALAAFAAPALGVLPGLSLAQARPIHFIVPYPAGGPLDIMARALAEKVKDSLGPIVVENKPGAGGNIGADFVAKAAPDGLTLVMGAVATHAINPWLYARLPYDPIRDFTPITGVARVPNVLVMTPETASRLGIASVVDLVDYAKKNPGKLNYGSGGNGSAGHLAGEMFKAEAGVHMVHIPYAGGNPAQLALLSGQVDLTFDNLASAAANIKAGRLKALAVTTARRSSAMPDVPTIAEAGRSV